MGCGKGWGKAVPGEEKSLISEGCPAVSSYFSAIVLLFGAIQTNMVPEKVPSESLSFNLHNAVFTKNSTIKSAKRAKRRHAR